MQSMGLHVCVYGFHVYTYVSPNTQCTTQANVTCTSDCLVVARPYTVHVQLNAAHLLPIKTHTNATLASMTLWQLQYI